MANLLILKLQDNLAYNDFYIQYLLLKRSTDVTVTSVVNQLDIIETLYNTDVNSSKFINSVKKVTETVAVKVSEAEKSTKNLSGCVIA